MLALRRRSFAGGDRHDLPIRILDHADLRQVDLHHVPQPLRPKTQMLTDLPHEHRAHLLLRRSGHDHLAVRGAYEGEDRGDGEGGALAHARTGLAYHALWRTLGVQ